MATKIGYVSQPPTAQINWAEVGANFSGMLNEEARVREEKKAEIDRATNEQMKVLQNAPTGDSANMNQWALKYAADAQKQLLMLNGALKSGQLKPQDYTLIRQNLADGTDQAFTLSQEYQNEYKDKMARLKSNDPNASSQELEIYLMQSVEGFGNFNKSELVINPLTGQVMVGFKNDKGQLESDPNKLVGINNLRNRTKAKFDKYNMDAAVAQGKQSFGDFETIVRKIGSRLGQGSITTISDPTFRNQAKINEWLKKGWITQEDAAKMSTFDKTEDAWLEGQLSMYNTTSLLTDNLRNIGGQKFSFTFNPAEQNENTILLKQVDGNVVPDFESEIGKKQRAMAKEGLRTVLRGAIDHTEKMTTVNDYTAPSYAPQYVYEARAGKQDLQNAVSEIGKLYYGDDSAIRGATDYFSGYRGGVKNVTRDESGVSITYLNPNTSAYETKRINFKGPNGDLLTQEEFIRSAGPLLTGQKDVSTALAKGGYDKNATFNPTTQKYVAETKIESTQSTSSNNIKNMKQINDDLINRISKINFKNEQGGVKEEILKQFAGFPVTIEVTPTGTYGGDEIKLRAKGYNPITLDADLYTESGSEEQRTKLKDYLFDVLKAENAASGQSNTSADPSADWALQ